MTSSLSETESARQPRRRKVSQSKIISYRGFQRITKIVCMWLLVGVGAIIECLTTYATQEAGISLSFDYAVASLMAVWLICNEIISILENYQRYRGCPASVSA